MVRRMKAMNRRFTHEHDHDLKSASIRRFFGRHMPVKSAIFRSALPLPSGSSAILPLLSADGNFRMPRDTSRTPQESQKFTVDFQQTTHYHMVVDQLDTTFAALSDPTRRGMIEQLSHGPASVHGLTERFALSQQMISKHIAYLVRARIVIKTKRGRESVCMLRPEAIKTVSDWAFNYRRFWEESFEKLDVVVKQMKEKEARDGKKHG